MNLSLLNLFVSRIIYQTSSFGLSIAALSLYTPFQNVLDVKPVFSFIFAFSSLNIDTGFIQKYSSGDDFDTKTPVFLALKFFVFYFVALILTAAYYVFQKPLISIGLFGLIVFSYSLVYIVSTLQFFFLRNNLESVYSFAYYIPVSFLAYGFLFVIFFLKGNIPFSALWIYLCFQSIILLLSLYISLKALFTPLRFSLPTFSFACSLVRPSLNTFLIAQSANLVELIPYLIFSKASLNSNLSSVALSQQVYFTFVIYPFLLFFKKLFAQGMFPSCVSPLRALFQSLKYIKYTLLYLVISFLLVCVIYYVPMLSPYRPLSFTLFCLSPVLPLTVIRTYISYSLLSKSAFHLSQMFPFLVFCLLSPIFGISSISTNFPLLLAIYEIAFIASVISGDSLADIIALRLGKL